MAILTHLALIYDKTAELMNLSDHEKSYRWGVYLRSKRYPNLKLVKTASGKKQVK